MLTDLTQQSSLPAEATNGPSQWQLWLTSSVKLLSDASLLRSLHPVCTTLSPVEVKDCICAGISLPAAVIYQLTLLSGGPKQYRSTGMACQHSWLQYVSDLIGSTGQCRCCMHAVAAMTC